MWKVLDKYATKKKVNFISHTPFNSWVAGTRDIPPNVGVVIDMIYGEYVDERGV